MASLFSGAVFGAAMTAAGFHNPAVILAQMRFENWHMLQAFLTATACSAIIYSIAETVGLVKIPPKSSSSLGLFGLYDGNVIGGTLLGAGIALSGSCPGAVFTQVAAGLRSGFYTFGGALLGAVLWTGMIGSLVQRQKQKANVRPEARTFHQQLQVSRGAMLVLLEAVCLVIVTLAASFTLRSPDVRLGGPAAGLCIGLAQLVSIAIRRSMLGASGSFLHMGNLFWSAISGSHPVCMQGHRQSLLFASGVVAGAWSLLQTAPSLAVSAGLQPSPLLALVGGISMVVGASLAGGCTSGHGISGISLLSVSSIVSIASAFATGPIVASLVY
ncbi:hypothetical protein HIM_01360 [Hirsutella minnesotensis 3608]|nr:hypothetical protein HIM_01360 [Hirsutella minnesotensis 3608]